MVTATLTRERLREDFASPFARVDRAAGVIRGVKLCGILSKRRRRYPLNMLREHLGLYRGARVFFNPHPESPRAKRDPDREIGWIDSASVHLQESGAYGDLHLLTTNPRSQIVMEAADKNPSLFALSHDADGELSSPDAQGYRTVERLIAVHALDCVTFGGVNTSLFEDAPNMTFREFLAGRANLAAFRLLEDDYGDSPMPDTASDPETHLIEAVKACLSSDDPALHDKAKKIMKLLRPEMPDEDGDEDTTTGMPVKEDAVTLRDENKRLTEEVEGFRLEGWIREECDRLKVPATPKLIGRLRLMRDKKAITEHLQEDFVAAPRRQPGPRSAGNPPPSKAPVTVPQTTDEFVKAYKGR